MASDLLQQVTRGALESYMRRDEEMLRGLLSRWVSELEPVVIYGRDNMFAMKGLGIMDDPTGMIVVPNPAWRPGLMDYLMPRRSL